MRTREHYEVELATLHHQIQDLGNLAATAVARALDALARQDSTLARQVVEDDALIDRARRLLEEHAVTLIACQQPVARDLRCLVAAITLAGEFERIADHAKGIARLTAGPADARPLAAPADLLQLGAMARASLDHALAALAASDEAVARTLAAEDEQIDQFYRQLKARLIAAVAGSPDPARAVDLLFVAQNLERVADRATNVAERVVYWASAQVVELNP